jgi:hypothetical protein
VPRLSDTPVPLVVSILQTTVTYVYTLGWRSSQIVSLFFDQPAAHHNPLRDPFPSASVTAGGGRIGAYTIRDATLIKQLIGLSPNLPATFGSSGAEVPREFFRSVAFTQERFVYDWRR